MTNFRNDHYYDPPEEKEIIEVAKGWRTRALRERSKLAEARKIIKMYMKEHDKSTNQACQCTICEAASKTMGNIAIPKNE